MQTDSKEVDLLNIEFEEIFNLYWKKLYVIAYNRLNDSELSKDMVQDVFIYYLQKRESIKIEVGIEAYLKKALQFQIIAHYRKNLINSKAIDQLLYQMEQNVVEIADTLDRQDLLHTVKRELNKMPASMRMIFNLRIKNYAVDEISSHTGLSEKTVRNNISMGINRMKKAITKDFPEDYLTLLVILSILFGKDF